MINERGNAVLTNAPREGVAIIQDKPGLFQVILGVPAWPTEREIQQEIKQEAAKKAS